jgi:DNA-binding LytR/AlgR family response regulator
MLAPNTPLTTKSLKQYSKQIFNTMEKNPYLHIGGWLKVPPAEILFFEADINYTTIHFANGKKQMVATTLKAFEERFKPYNFFRVHKTYLVNMACIKHFCEHENTVQLSDNKHINISRRRLTDFKMKIFKTQSNLFI